MQTTEQRRRDAEQLAGFGYRQELRRSLGALASFAVAFSYISVSTGIFALFGFGLAAGGPAVVWGFPLVIAGQLLVALGFAELAAHYPLAGSIYVWTRQIAPHPYAWLVGWIYLCANLLTVTAVAYSLQAPLVGLLGWDASSVPLRVAIALGTLALATLVNALGVRWLALVSAVGVAAEVLGMTVLALVLLILAHHQPVGVVLSAAGTGRGSGGPAGAFLTALFMSLFVVYGFDTAGSLAEETHDPTRLVPRTIVASVLGAGIIGTVFLLSALLAIPNIRAAMGSADPLAETIAAGLPPLLARAYLLLICLSVFVCALSIQAATVRIAFGMARDGQLPASGLLGRVSPRSGTPVAATVLVGALAALPLLATQHVAVLAAGATGLIYLAYLLAGLALLRARLGGWPARPAPFALGRWGVAINGLAVLWGGAMLLNFAWPRASTNPPLGIGPLWLRGAPILECLAAVVLLAGAIAPLPNRRRRPAVLTLVAYGHGRRDGPAQRPATPTPVSAERRAPGEEGRGSTHAGAVDSATGER